MTTREYITLDKAAWGPGPWQTEPDKVSWTDETTGMPCLVVRVPHHGALCGYVGVNPDHPWHGIGYGECTQEACSEEWCYDHSPGGSIEIHGGLTFADGCSHGDDDSTGICHIPEQGQPDDVWWFGFDCSHSMDLCPATEARYRASGFGSPENDDAYRDIAYVREQVMSLAAQLAAVTP